VPSPTDFLIIQLGYREVSGLATTPEALRERLSRYSLRAVLDIVARISGLLHGLDEAERNTVGQQSVCTGLFGPRACEVWDAVERHRQDVPEARAVLLFSELQLVNFVKVALLLMTAEDDESNPDLSGLGDAMLMVWDLCMQQMHPPAGVDPELPLPEAWHQVIVANGLFHAGGRWQHDLTRSHDLYLTDKPQLRTHPDYVDLPLTAQELTGMPTQALWAVLFGFAAHWRTIGLRNIGQVTGGIDRRAYFTAQFTFTEEEIAHFFALASAPAVDVQQAVRTRYTLEQLQPLDLLPFARTPLLAVGDLVYCVSTALLSAKLTTGLYHLFLDPRQSAAERDRFLRYVGVVYEEYVDRLLRRLYAPGRYLDEATLRAHLPARSCDGAILFLDVDALVLIESKSTIFPLEVRTARNWALYERNLQDMFIDAARQLDATVTGMLDGRLRHLGVQPGGVHSCLPVVVTLEEVAVMRPMYQRVLDEIRGANLLAQRGVRDLQIVTISELEALEANITTGLSLQQLLAEKISDEDWKGVSLRNYCFAHRPELMETPNPFLAARSQELFEAALAFFRAHGPGPEVM
jgi:hypothetical protein